MRRERLVRRDVLKNALAGVAALAGSSAIAGSTETLPERTGQDGDGDAGPADMMARALLENFPGVVMIRDAEGRVLWIGNRPDLSYITPPEDLMGRGVDAWVVGHPKKSADSTVESMRALDALTLKEFRPTRGPDRYTIVSFGNAICSVINIPQRIGDRVLILTTLTRMC